METEIAWVKTSSFLSEEMQNELMRLRDTFRSGSFEIGDIAAECVSQMARLRYDITNGEIFGEIGRFCGKSARTVRYYYETATFYPDEIRNRFDTLSFGIFVLARRFPNWEEVLAYAQDHPTDSEERVRVQFLGVPPCLSDYLTADQEAIVRDDLLTVPENVVTPERSRYRYIDVVSSLREGVAAMRAILEGDDMDERGKTTMRELITDIETRLPILLDAIEKMT